MAAPPSKPSPSNQDVSSKGAESSTNAPAMNPAEVTLKDPPSTEPTYDSSEQSTYYVAAKAFLNAGQFEEALTKVEEGIQVTRGALEKMGKTEDYISLHESMALFHYLYGTTLLYSIEETADSMAMPSAEGGGESPDDAEIAWEMLEVSRSILERIVQQPSATDKQKLDLAQVYLREGDLHRMNGQYANAVQDYESCLKYREASDSIGPFDRKIADVHYNLGLTNMLLVAEQKGEAASAPTPEGALDAKPAAIDESEIDSHRARSFQHYYACGKTLCGQLAFLAGIEPSDFFKKVEADVPCFKTTGEDDDQIEHPKVAGIKLQSLRKHVAGLSASPGNEADFHDLKETLDEIQETIDESDKSESGVSQLAAMKAEISAMVAGVAGQSSDSLPQEGGPVAASAAGETTIGFGSAEAAARTAVAQPLMAVKKKKKRPAEDDKKQHADPAKRPKSE